MKAKEVFLKILIFSCLGIFFTVSIYKAFALEALDYEDIRLVYGSSTESIPYLRTWDNSGSSWGSATTSFTASSTIRWTINKIHATSTDEIVGLLSVPGSGSSTFWAAHYTSSSWTVVASSTRLPVSNASKRSFDVEYEAISGDAIVVYSNYTSNPQYLRYRAGTGWTSSSVFVSPPGSGAVEWVELTRRPGSNEIALAYSDSNSDLFAVTWNGSSWETGSVTTLETNLADITAKNFDAVYESVSGDLLIVWGNSSGIHSGVKNLGSSSFSTATAISVSSPTAIDIAAEPAGNRVSLAAVANSDDFKTATWNGLEWIDSATPDSIGNAPGAGDISVATGWVADLGVAVATYEDASDGTGGRIDWAKWTESSGWAIQSDYSGLSSCNNIGGDKVHSRLIEPFPNSHKLMEVFVDGANDLCAATFNGSSWSATNSGAPLEMNIPSIASVPFSIAVQQGTTTLLLGNHSQNQTLDVFNESGSKSNAEIFRFGLNVSQGQMSVSQLVFSIATSTGISNSDVSGLEIIEDANTDGSIAESETNAIGGSGSVSISGGTISFSSSFVVSSSKQYIVRGDFSTLETLDRLELTLATSGLSVSAGYSVMGTTTQAIHQEGVTSLSHDDVRFVYGEGAVKQIREVGLANTLGSWSKESSGPTVSATIRWIVTKIHPTSTEELSAVMSVPSSGTSTLWLIRYSNGWYIDASSSAISNSNGGKRGFDLEYEAQSGDALFVYSTNTTNVAFRTRSNGSWSGEQVIFSSPPGSGVVEWIELARLPGSNAITLVYSDANSDLFAVTWNGSSWDTAQVVTLETTITQTTTKLFDVAYEEVSGNLIVVWGNSSGIISGLRLATSTSFTTTTAVSVASPVVIDIAAEPDGNRMALAAIANTDDFKTVTWDGSSWVNAATPDATGAAPGSGDMMVGAGWVGHTGVAIATYEDASDGVGSRIDWARWVSSTGWSIQSDATGFSGCGNGATNNSYQVETMTRQNKLVTVFSDSGNGLCAGTYNGSSWVVTTGGNPIEAQLSSIASVPFSLAIRAVLPVVSFTNTTSSVSESVGTSTVTLSVSATSSQAISVQYRISASSTATSTDYSLTNGTSTISAGSTSTSLAIPILNNTTPESQETIILTLASPMFVEIGATSTFTLTITDDDVYPTSSFASSSSSGSESTATATIEISVNATTTDVITLTIATSGAASYGADYTLSTTTATIASGSSSALFSITVIEDSEDESDETIVLELTSSTNALLGVTTTFTYTISDNDETVSVNAPRMAQDSSRPAGGGGGLHSSIQATHSLQGNGPAQTKSVSKNSEMKGEGTKTANNKNSATPIFTQSFSLGDSHPEILELQKFLNKQGFSIALSGPGSLGYETEKFGALTRQALSRFQETYKKELGITRATGIFGPATRALMLRMLNDSGSPHVFYRTLSEGMRGSDVDLLQSLLAKDSNIYPEGIVNGSFGPLTRKAVERFQLKYQIVKNNHPAFGVVGPKTIEKLKEF